MKAIRVHAPGGPEVLTYEDVADPSPVAGQALVRVEAAGVNFADGSARRGANPSQAPVGVGSEGAGTIVEIGPEVTDFKPGDRVVWNGVPGSYAEFVAAPVARLISIPENVTTKQAAASLVQGLTAHYLACSTYPLGSGDTCLIHAAAGGVGLLLCQIARMRGAIVIGTVSTEEKARAAREAGANETIIYTEIDFEDEVKRLTDGRGVSVVYDSVGKTTFLKGFNCLRPRGTMVLYGQSSGPIEPFDSALLAQRGSLYFTRTSLVTHTSSREELLERTKDILSWIGSGALRVHIHAGFPLREAAKAQEAIENRKTIGKVLLIP